MGTCSELRLALEDAVVAADAAIAAAERLATHGILPSHDFERLMSSLQEVQTALYQCSLIRTHEPSREGRWT